MNTHLFQEYLEVSHWHCCLGPSSATVAAAVVVAGAAGVVAAVVAAAAAEAVSPTWHCRNFVSLALHTGEWMSRPRFPAPDHQPGLARQTSFY